MELHISPEVIASFSRSKAEWLAALKSAKDDTDELRRLSEDMHLSPVLSNVDKRELVKAAASLLGTTYSALNRDLKLHEVENEPKRDHLSFAREAVEGFGPGALIHTKGQFWTWRNRGVWDAVEEQVIRKAAIQCLEGAEAVTDATVRSVLNLMRDEAHDEGTQFDQPADRRINCANGTLDYANGAWTLREHRQADNLTALVPVAFEPDAKCPRFMRFLAEVFEGDKDAADKVSAVLEMLGYSLLQSCRYEKFAVLVGAGSNGKSVLLEVLRALAGPGQVAAVEPAHMGDKFKRGHLRGKLLNIVPELPVGSMLADAAMKSFTSGDVVNGEFKGGQPFDYVPYATIWLGTNHMPHTKDLSQGMFRRALILKFNRQFSESQREIGLADRLKAELPGIFAAACQALGKVFERGYITSPASSVDALKRWRMDSDQVANFVEDCCRMDAGLGPTPHATLFQAFREWAAAENISHTVTGKAFTQRLEGLGAVADRYTMAGKRERGFLGIDLL
jgi:putative DNA primase/helicase